MDGRKVAGGGQLLGVDMGKPRTQLVKKTGESGVCGGLRGLVGKLALLRHHINNQAQWILEHIHRIWVLAI